MDKVTGHCGLVSGPISTSLALIQNTVYHWLMTKFCMNYSTFYIIHLKKILESPHLRGKVGIIGYKINMGDDCRSFKRTNKTHQKLYE